MKKNTISMTYCHTKNNRTLLVKVSYLLFRKYVLKDHILQEAIEKGEDHDFSMVNELLTVALAPFDEHPELEHLCNPTPMKSKNIKLSCSS